MKDVAHYIVYRLDCVKTIQLKVLQSLFFVKRRGSACQYQKSRNPIVFYLNPAHPL